MRTNAPTGLSTACTPAIIRVRPLPTATTEDDFVAFPAWYPADREESWQIAEKYLNLRYGRQVRDFMSRIREKDVHLRRIVQFMDISADYVSRRFR